MTTPTLTAFLPAQITAQVKAEFARYDKTPSNTTVKSWLRRMRSGKASFDTLREHLQQRHATGEGGDPADVRARWLWLAALVVVGLLLYRRAWK